MFSKVTYIETNYTYKTGIGERRKEDLEGSKNKRIALDILVESMKIISSE